MALVSVLLAENLAGGKDMQLFIRDKHPRGPGNNDGLGGVLLQIQALYESEFMTFINASYHIQKSCNEPRLGEIFDPAGIASAAAAANSTVYTISKLSYADLLLEKPPIYRDRENVLNSAMPGVFIFEGASYGYCLSCVQSR